MIEQAKALRILGSAPQTTPSLSKLTIDREETDGLQKSISKLLLLLFIMIGYLFSIWLPRKRLMSGAEKIVSCVQFLICFIFLIWRGNTDVH